jgi:hypothetical protein
VSAGGYVGQLEPPIIPSQRGLPALQPHRNLAQWASITRIHDDPTDRGDGVLRRKAGARQKKQREKQNRSHL